MKINLGFTLIELLVVISVIGVLATVVAVGINPLKQMQKGRDAGKKSDLAQIKEALHEYFVVSNNVMPPNPYPGVACFTGSQTQPGCLEELVDGGFLKNLPSGYGYYNYGRGNIVGALIKTSLEAISPTTDTMSTMPETCRPFATSNWCSSIVATKDYCICNPY